MLQVRDIHVYYDKAHVLKGVSLDVHEGETVTLIGANGAGKTTTLKAIVGLLKPTEGDITFLGRTTKGLRVSEIINLGVTLIPEGRGIFPQLSVEENLLVGAYHRSDFREISADLQQVYSLLPILRDRRKQAGGTLSGGEQQMLAIGRAMMSSPRLLLADEPSMGLAPVMVQNTFKILKLLQERGTTILLVEQNARMALSIAHRGYVLQGGRIVLSGNASDLRDDPDVQKAYIGLSTARRATAGT